MVSFSGQGPEETWRFLDGLQDTFVWHADEQERLIEVTSGVESLLGLQRDLVLEQPDLWRNRVYSRHRRRYRQALSYVFQTGKPSSIEYRATLPEARSAWLRDYVSYDKTTRLLSGITTVAGERETDERLGFLNKAGRILSSSIETRNLLDKLADLILGSLADVCIIEFRERDEVFVTARVARNRQLARELERPGSVLLDRETLRPRLRRGRPVLYPTIAPRQLKTLIGTDRADLLTGRHRPHAAILAPLTLRNRILGSIVILCTDPGRNYVTKDAELLGEMCRQAATALEQARLFEESRHSEQRLAHENELKDEFLGIMSHELKSPLTVIYGISCLLPSVLPPLEEDTRALVEDLASASERTVHLVEALMLLARLNVGQQPDLETVGAAEHLKEASSDFLKQYPDTNVAVDDSSTAEVLAASPFLKQILLNLLSNAQKYSPAGAPIHLAAVEDGSEVVFSVTDTGSGVPEDDLEHIFNRFFRSSNSDGVAGAGLGLSICKRLVDAQGGRIWATNVEGGGLRISFALARA